MKYKKGEKLPTGKQLREGTKGFSWIYIKESKLPRYDQKQLSNINQQLM